MFGANAFGWAYFAEAYAGTTGITVNGTANTVTATAATAAATTVTVVAGTANTGAMASATANATVGLPPVISTPGASNTLGNLGAPQGPVSYGYTHKKTGAVVQRIDVTGTFRFDLTEQIAEEDDLILAGVL